MEDVHTEHCCFKCGCKYNEDANCTVVFYKIKRFCYECQKERPYVDMTEEFVAKHGGERWDFDHEKAVEILLNYGILFVAWGEKGNTRTELMVNCNDVFYWGTADCEEIPAYDLEKLYLMWEENPRYGHIRWSCIHRNLRPQIPMIKKMKESDYWDDELESLPAPAPS